MKRRDTTIILVIIVLAIALYVTFLYQPKCKDVACWENKFVECSRAKYINEPLDVTWEYKIKGKQGNFCEVEVKALEIKRGLKKAETLVGKSMTCLTPLGLTTAPEANTQFCSGDLKEEMQELIISKLHEYIVQNVRQIDEEFNKIEGVNV